MNRLYKIATDNNRSLEVRWEALHKMIDKRKKIPSDVAKIFARTAKRRLSA